MSKEIEMEVRQIIKENVKTTFSIDEVAADQSLVEFGFNSIDFIKVIVCIEPKYGIKFNNEDLDYVEFDTIEKLVSFIENKRKVQSL